MNEEAPKVEQRISLKACEHATFAMAFNFNPKDPKSKMRSNLAFLGGFPDDGMKFGIKHNAYTLETGSLQNEKTTLYAHHECKDCQVGTEVNYDYLMNSM